MEKLVSIILPNYNHSEYLQDRLDSIFNQSYENFEVILLDDCSTDTSLDILKTYETHPKVSYFIPNKKNSGSPFIQWQKGLKLAKGDFIWIAESDDFCDLNFLETQLKCIESADVAVAKTMAYYKGTSDNEVLHPVFDEAKQKDSILYCPILNVSAVLFKASKLTDLNEGFYTNFKIIGDRVFYFEFFLDSKIVLNESTINYFRQSDSSISKLNDRSIAYYSSYFNEHSKFISYAKNNRLVSKTMYKRYVAKFYNRVSNRVSQKKKRSLPYLLLFFRYKLRLFV
ncbi:glycosyltransferase family 2 protein [Psychroserpens damuponensis]|uniref:glycosyltransferase family 2 protein n=1 Tax=Psychroserpens damuponensis TaxID=943936 RepID=UPI0006946602|nr:glycosyltransferase family 2 protein [Psychroserpens damuponensis]